MKQLLVWLALVQFVFAQTTTPNLGLTLPAPGSQNWDVPIVQDLKLIDSGVLCKSGGAAALRGECYASLSVAIASADCPATGCTVDMSSPAANHALGTVNAGTKVVKVILGSFQDYTMDHLICTTGMDFGGRGAIGAGGGTLVTSVGANSQPLIVALQQNTYSINCPIHGVQFAGAAGNTSQEGLLFDVSTLTGAAIQNMQISDVTFSGFNGSSIDIKGRPNDALSAVQFLRFLDVTAYGGASLTSAVMKMTGYSGQITFDTVFLNSPNSQDVMYLGPSNGTSVQGPSGNQFRNITLQGSGVCGHFGGVATIVIDGGFIESCPTAFSVTADSSGTGTNSNNGILLKSLYNPGTAGGTAFLTDTDANSVVSVRDNGLYNAGGAFINGANASRVDYCGNYGTGATAGCSIPGPLTASSAILPSAVNAVDLGSAALPFRKLWLGTAATNNWNFAGTATGARTITLPDVSFTPAQSVGSGTSTSNGTAIAAGVSQAQPAITVTGATVTDTAVCALNAAPVATWQTGIQLLPAVVTANTVTPWLSNPTAGSITPAAVVVRCTVIR